MLLVSPVFVAWAKKKLGGRGRLRFSSVPNADVAKELAGPSDDGSERRCEEELGRRTLWVV